MSRALDPIPTIRWIDGAVRILDQRRLPRREAFLDIRTPAEMIRAIRTLAVRGAPALGIAGAFGVALAAAEHVGRGAGSVASVRRTARRVAACRPTAVNLGRGVERAVARLDTLGSLPVDGRFAEMLRQVGEEMLAEDLEASRLMAEHGAPLIPGAKAVITHCNTGGLATGGLGTALAVVREAYARQGIREVLVDETRPLLQGGG